MPVGKHVELQVIHNAKVQRLHLQLADRSALVQRAWAHHFQSPIRNPAMVNGFAGQRSYAGDGAAPDSDTPDPQAYVGAQVEPLTPHSPSSSAFAPATACSSAAFEDKSPAANAGSLRATWWLARMACR